MTLPVSADAISRKLGLFSAAILMFFGIGCVATVPQIRALRRNVTPRSENAGCNAIPVVVGPSLEVAL